MDSSKFGRMGRRRFVETLSGLGVSAATVNELDPDDLEDITQDPEEEVPYLARYETLTKEEGKPPSRKPVYKSIPRDEWERRRTAIDAMNKINEKVNRDFEDPRIGAVFKSHDQSPTEFGVAVKVPDDPALRESLEVIEEELPSEKKGRTPEKNSVERGGIPVDVEIKDMEPLACYNLQNYDPVPGGQATAGGTLTGTFYSNKRSLDGWVTAGHVAEEGAAISQSTGSSYDFIGTGRDSVNEEQNGGLRDCAFVEPISDEGVIGYICEEDNSDKQGFPIGGIILNRELQNNVGNTDYGVRLQGKISCKDTAHISEMNQGDSITVEYGKASGDSGGPAYRVVDGDAYIVGIIGEGSTGFENPFGSTQCTTAETAEDILDGYFW